MVVLAPVVTKKAAEDEADSEEGNVGVWGSSPKQAHPMRPNLPLWSRIPVRTRLEQRKEF